MQTSIFTTDRPLSNAERLAVWLWRITLLRGSL